MRLVANYYRPYPVTLFYVTSEIYYPVPYPGIRPNVFPVSVVITNSWLFRVLKTFFFSFFREKGERRFFKYFHSAFSFIHLFCIRKQIQCTHSYRQTGKRVLAIFIFYNYYNDWNIRFLSCLCICSSVSDNILKRSSLVIRFPTGNRPTCKILCSAVLQSVR